MTKDSKEKYMYILGGIVVAGMFGVVVLKLAKNLDANLEIGALIGAFGSVVGYFYGSSKGSADKNDLLNQPK